MVAGILLRGRTCCQNGYRSGGGRIRMSHPRIYVSDYAGYCWGVERALKVAHEAAEHAEKPVKTLGPLIHNPAVIEELVSRGVDLVESVESVDGGTVIIRSHGIPQADKDMLDASDAQIVDATCTFVKAAQEKAARLRDQGYLVIVLGEPSHPEVLGIRSYAGPDSLVVQTTQPRTRLSALVAELALRTRELLVCNTICNATHRRQRAAVETAESVDLVLVIGGRNSGNTTRLSELCAEVQPKTYHIESAEEIQDEWLEDVASVGVTAGASTPADQIGAVLARLEGMGGIR